MVSHPRVDRLSFNCSKHRLSPITTATGFSALNKDFARRRFLSSALYLSALSIWKYARPAFAETSLTTYEDSFSGFSLSYPTTWTTDAVDPLSDNPAERTLVWYPKDVPPRDVNITLLITNTAADYTKLGSFGTAEDFGQGLVNSMDQSYRLRTSFGRRANTDDIQTAILVSAKSLRGMYSIEYLLKKPNEEQKRLLSLVALAFDGRYNRLYTLTAQCPDENYSKYQNDIQTVFESFTPPLSVS